MSVGLAIFGPPYKSAAWCVRALTVSMFVLHPRDGAPRWQTRNESELASVMASSSGALARHPSFKVAMPSPHVGMDTFNLALTLQLHSTPLSPSPSHSPSPHPPHPHPSHPPLTPLTLTPLVMSLVLGLFGVLHWPVAGQRLSALPAHHLATRWVFGREL